MGDDNTIPFVVSSMLQLKPYLHVQAAVPSKNLRTTIHQPATDDHIIAVRTTSLISLNHPTTTDSPNTTALSPRPRSETLCAQTAGMKLHLSRLKTASLKQT
jgi:hypothetical protein